MSEQNNSEPIKRRRSRHEVRQLRQLDAAIAAATPGSIAHVQALKMKQDALGMRLTKPENPEPSPIESEVESAGGSFHPWSEWLDPKYPDQLKPLQFRKIQQSAILPLDAVQLRLMEIMSVEESNRYVIGRNDHTLQLMRRRDQTIVTLAQMQQALDAQITKLGLDKDLFEAWMTEPNAAEKHAGWRQLPFEERMNRFRIPPKGDGHAN